MTREPLPESRSDQDAGFALLMVIMIILVATALSVLLLASVVNAVRPTLAQRKQVRTLHAAEAGMNVVLGQIRVATQADPLDTTKTVGDKSKLPCTTSTTPLTGQVGGEDGNITYSVQVTYYRADPTGQSDSWRSNTANIVTCGASATEQPKFALISSVGRGDTPANSASATSGDRTAEIVYAFKTDNSNAIGGAIYLNGLCLDAGSTMPPPAGTSLLLSTCVPGKDSQKFYWRDDLSLALSATLTSTPMCITADPSGSTVVQITNCDGLEHQAWGVDPSLHIIKGGTKYYLCSNATVSTSCSGSVNVSFDQAVGSGRAGYPPATAPDPQSGQPIQWVNYRLYGSCIDVSGWTINNYLQLYPCKQVPDDPWLYWNQGFYWHELDAATHQSWLYTYAGTVNQPWLAAKNANASQMCLRSDAVGIALRVYACLASEPRMTWVVNRDTGVYDTSYTIVDNNGMCLSDGPASSDRSTSLRVYTCDGSDDQKWNAPPVLNTAKLKDFRETTGQ